MRREVDDFGSRVLERHKRTKEFMYSLYFCKIMSTHASARLSAVGKAFRMTFQAGAEVGEDSNYTHS